MPNLFHLSVMFLSAMVCNASMFYSVACPCPLPVHVFIHPGKHSLGLASILIKGDPPIAADPGGFPDFGILGCFGKC